MIKLGQEVSFIPHWNIIRYDSRAEIGAKTITGTVIYANHQKRNFTVEYSCGGTTQRESFKFSDIGNEIHIVGGGKHGRKKNR